jgi:RNA polymerase sigma factor (sigma-70 family)
LQNNWSFQGAAFRRFLKWLDEGADSGGEKYLEIRRRLVLYFARKHCSGPEDLADETLTRVARRLEEEGGITDSPPARYCYIVARFVFLEYYRKAELREVSLTDTMVSRQAEFNLIAVSLPDVAAVAQERRLDCLDRCLGALEQEQRVLLLDYYKDEKSEKIAKRRQLAERLGVSVNALSIRACRLREKLHTCVRKCCSDEI